MSHASKRDNYKEQAKKAYAYWLQYGTLGCVVRGWRWLVRKPERLTAISTLAIFVATAVAIGVGLAQWRALHNTDLKIGRQLTLMEADQRPRINTPKITIAGPLVFREIGNDAAIPVKIEAKNIGKSVAFNVFPWADMYVFVGNRPSKRIATNDPGVCRPHIMSATALDHFGDAVFPEESLPSNQTFSARLEKEEIAASDSVRQTSDRRLLMFIVACIDYRTENARYKTGATYEVRQEGEGSLGISPSPGKTIPAASLHLEHVNTFAR